MILRTVSVNWSRRVYLSFCFKHFNIFYFQEGGFVVRKCGKYDPQTPYSLSIWCQGKCRHLQIYIRHGFKYAVGKEKKGEMVRGLSV